MKKLAYIFLMLGLPFMVRSQSVITTSHNLSLGGSSVKIIGETGVCIFCHTSHSAVAKNALWNKKTGGVVYTLYNSSTLDAEMGQPDGSSILCLSCHDGTIALGNLLSKSTTTFFSGSASTMYKGKNNLSTDLSDDHPISFIYDPHLASLDGELKNPLMLSPKIRLENDKLQCTSCHNPHDNTNGNYLVLSDRYSEICIDCHDKKQWVSSAHSISSAKWNGSGEDPWYGSDYTTVAENACQNCHQSHNAGSKEWLLTHREDEENCLNCHNGNVAETNIEAELSKIYTHDVYKYTQHDPTEDLPVNTEHVSCSDCHNPHTVNNQKAQAPYASGYISGVSGISQNGILVNPIQFEYELCYRCHADSPSKPTELYSRVIRQNNVRLEFDLSNPSYHPVAGAGANSDVPSLIAPLNESSIIYCGDCHAGSGDKANAGPHGSSYPAILKYRYETDENVSESALSYELCYSCHERNSILGNESFSEHALHIRDNNTSCNACHDPHGISRSEGNIVNNSNLINFNTKYAKPLNGVLRFEDTGYRKGNCTLSCHGEEHNLTDY